MGTSGEIYLGKIYSLSIQIWHNIQQSRYLLCIFLFCCNYYYFLQCRCRVNTASIQQINMLHYVFVCLCIVRVPSAICQMALDSQTVTPFKILTEQFYVKPCSSMLNQRPGTVSCGKLIYTDMLHFLGAILNVSRTFTF